MTNEEEITFLKQRLLLLENVVEKMGLILATNQAPQVQQQMTRLGAEWATRANQLNKETNHDQPT